MKKLEEQSLFIPVGEKDEIHIKRFYSNPDGKPVLLLHGSVESGRIFYSLSQKGWGPFLARNGFDVFIPDLRGRGESRPPVQRGSSYGNVEVILEDIPRIIDQIKAIKGDVPMHWMAHSWGGIQMLCYLARFPQTKVSSLVFFSALRLKRVKNMARFLNINLGYNILLRLVTHLAGYFPAKSLKVGSENESLAQFEQTRAWIMNKPWISPHDGLDYAKKIPETLLPPTLYLAGAGDVFMGHPSDVKVTMEEAGQADQELWILGKKNGFLRDYGHNDSLYHKDAVKDHFPKILEWIIKIDS
jgi:pimeloyl-ACP methyl ester carboxylesterase